METMGSFNHNLKGFTIVELLIVVVVIAILAAITIVGYNGISTSAKKSALQTEVTTAGKKIVNYYNELGSYPDNAWVTSNVNLGQGTSFAYSTSGNTFCFQGVSDSIAMSTGTNIPSTSETLCAAGATPTFGTAATTQVVVNWAATANATGYNVRCSRSTTYAASTGNVSATKTGGSTLTHTFTGLNAGTRYYCNVQPIIGASIGSWSSNGSQTTSTAAAPAAPTVASKTATSVNLTWGAVSGTYQYGVRCALSTNTTYSPTVYNVTNLTATSTSVTGLVANTTYICSVQSRGYNNHSAFSANLTVTTNAS